MRLRSDWPESLKDTAKILATHPDLNVKAIPQAIYIAEHDPG